MSRSREAGAEPRSRLETVVKVVKLGPLHARLALVLLALLVLAGGFNLYSTLVTTELYLQEVNQSMNLDLASNIVRMKHDRLLGDDGEVRTGGIEELLHWMMVVNPGPQFYLLDPDGKVLAFDPMAGEVLNDQVSIGPIREFLAQQRSPDSRRRTVLGDDPREPARSKVFSVAPLPLGAAAQPPAQRRPGGSPGQRRPEGSPTQHYLYIVLASHQVDSAAERLRDSYILRLSTRNGLAYLAVVLLSGLFIFGRMARPLRRLAARMQEFRPQESGEDSASTAGDEVRLLEGTFDRMAERIERQMEDIERMALARRELIANVSHDLRTPIASLRGYLDTLVLKDGALSQEERDEYLQIAVRQSERLGKLVQELFELTKLDAREVKPKLERFKLAELLQDNVQRFQLRAMEKGVRLRADFDPDLPPVRADIGLMERALENLIDNALRFTPAGGSVSLELREDPNRLEVRVVDTGCGISAEDLPHIFDRHWRSRSGTATVSEGAGLGLAITRRILELHDTGLEISSSPGVGTTASFFLASAPRTRPFVLADLQ